MPELNKRPGLARAASPAGRDPWLQYPRPNPGARVRLVCLPYSGGRASVFKALASQLPEDIEVCSVEFPGHGRRLGEAPLTRLQPLVEELTDVLAVRVRRPFVLLGYSVGALIAFQAAREFARRGAPGPQALFACAARAPHLRSTRPPLHELSRSELVAGLDRLAGRHNPLFDDEELLDVMEPVIRADLGLDETYDPGEIRPMSLPIAAFGGSEDWTVSGEALQAWSGHTTGEFSATVLPGGHFFLDEALPFFAQALTGQIKRVQEGWDGRSRL